MPPVRKATAIALPARLNLEQGMRTILLACLDHAQANIRGFQDSDEPEYLHQFRVGLRRFTSALKLFRGQLTLPAGLQARLADLSALLGRARDADVLVLATLPPMIAATRHTAFFQPLVTELHAYADTQRAAAQDALHSAGHAQLMLDLVAWVDGKGWRAGMPAAARAALKAPLTQFAGDAVKGANALVLKRAAKARRLGGRDSAALHRLRIACKQARYAVEFFAGIERRRRAARYTTRLTALQDALGHLNDLHVAQALLRALPNATPQATVAAAYLQGMAEVQSGSQRKLHRVDRLNIHRLVPHRI